MTELLVLIPLAPALLAIILRGPAVWTGTTMERWLNWLTNHVSPPNV
jgi:hypothetical protein